MSKPKMKDNTQKNRQEQEAKIILTIKDEHKYTLMLLSVIREQLADFDVGKTPDYKLMYDSMHYMANFPERFNHPIKHELIRAVINKDPENSSELESLLAEKKQIKSRAREVISALKSLLKDETILKEEQLKIFCKNYVEMIESHIEIESQSLFPKARKLLTPEELQSFEIKLYEVEDHDLASLVEERYKELSQKLNQRWGNWEEAANDFAFAEFVSLGAIFETIEPFSLGFSEISKIVKDISYKLYLENYNCYKDILTRHQPSPADYYEKPYNCVLACYKEYVSGLGQVVNVLKKTKEQISEPYEARKDFYKSNQEKSCDKKSRKDLRKKAA